MDLHPLVEASLPVVSGTVVLGGFGFAVWGLVQHRADRAPPVRGTRVWSRPVTPDELEALRQLPEHEAGPWGWVRRDDTHVALFADPYSTVDGMRVGTPWPYRAVVALDAEEPVLEYRAPTGFLVGVGLVLLPIAPLLLLLNHSMQAAKIETRLQALRREG